MTAQQDAADARLTMLLALRLGGVDQADALSVLDEYDAIQRKTVLAERALATPWSEWSEDVPPRDRIRGDMAELTRVADPDHIARRAIRTEGDLDAYRAEVLREAADWLTAKYGVTNRAAGDLRRLADGSAT